MHRRGIDIRPRITRHALRSQGGKALRLRHPAIAHDPAPNGERPVGPCDIRCAELGNLVEIIDAFIVQRPLDDRPDALDPFQVFGRATRDGCVQQAGRTGNPLLRFDQALCFQLRIAEGCGNRDFGLGVIAIALGIRECVGGRTTMPVASRITRCRVGAAASDGGNGRLGGPHGARCRAFYGIGRAGCRSTRCGNRAANRRTGPRRGRTVSGRIRRRAGGRALGITVAQRTRRRLRRINRIRCCTCHGIRCTRCRVLSAGASGVVPGAAPSE